MKACRNNGAFGCLSEPVAPRGGDRYALTASPLFSQIRASWEDALAPDAAGCSGYLPRPAGGNCHEQ